MGPARFGSSGAGGAHFPHLPREQHAKLTASAGVTDVTGSRREGFYLLDATRNFKKNWLTAKRNAKDAGATGRKMSCPKIEESRWCRRPGLTLLFGSPSSGQSGAFYFGKKVDSAAQR